jgi:hypothetical protein
MERTLAELLSLYPRDVQVLAQTTRSFLLEQIPAAEEHVDGTGPYVGYGYGPGYKGLVCTVIVSKTGVKLGFVDGARLADPRGLLEGSGSRHRFVQLKSSADLRQPGLKALVKAGLAHWKKTRKPR